MKRFINKVLFGYDSNHKPTTYTGPVVSVRHPNGEVRIRKVKHTTKPTAAQLGPITDFNLWHMHLATVTDATYGAYSRIETICSMEMLAFDAHHILSQAVK